MLHIRFPGIETISIVHRCCCCYCWRQPALCYSACDCICVVNGKQNKEFRKCSTGCVSAPLPHRPLGIVRSVLMFVSVFATTTKKKNKPKRITLLCALFGGLRIPEYAVLLRAVTALAKQQTSNCIRYEYSPTTRRTHTTCTLFTVHAMYTYFQHLNLNKRMHCFRSQKPMRVYGNANKTLCAVIAVAVAADMKVECCHLHCLSTLCTSSHTSAASKIYQYEPQPADSAIRVVHMWFASRRSFQQNIVNCQFHVARKCIISKALHPLKEIHFWLFFSFFITFPFSRSQFPIWAVRILCIFFSDYTTMSYRR